MILLNSKLSVYITSLRVNGSKPVDFVLDTGSPRTFMSRDTVDFIFGTKFDWSSLSVDYTFNDFSKNELGCHVFKCRNTVVDTVHIPEFCVLVPLTTISNTTNLLGVDFISACTMALSGQKGFKVTSFSQADYALNWRKYVDCDELCF